MLERGKKLLEEGHLQPIDTTSNKTSNDTTRSQQTNPLWNEVEIRQGQTLRSKAYTIADILQSSNYALDIFDQNEVTWYNPTNR